MTKKSEYNKTINFISHDNKGLKIAGYVILGVLICTILLIGIWFGIIRRYTDISVLESNLSEKETELKMAENELKKLASLEDDYLKYSFAYLTDDEKQLVSGKDILNKIEYYLMDSCAVMKMSLTDNKAVISLYDVTMEDASILMNALEKDSSGIISHVSTRTANNEVKINLEGRKLSVPAAEMSIILEAKNDE